MENYKIIEGILMLMKSIALKVINHYLKMNIGYLKMVFVLATVFVMVSGSQISYSASVTDSTKVLKPEKMYGDRRGGVRIDENSPDCQNVDSVIVSGLQVDLSGTITELTNDTILSAYKINSATQTGYVSWGLLALPQYLIGKDTHESGEGDTLEAATEACGSAYAPVKFRQVMRVMDTGSLWVEVYHPISSIQVVLEIRCCPIVND